VLFAVMAWRRGLSEGADKEDEQAAARLSRRLGFWPAAARSFVVIFIAEWGDLTQLATASLAAKYHDPITIFTAATSALWCVTAVAITAGHHAKKAVRPALLNKIAAGAFLLVGGYFIFEVIKNFY
jgi:Ca2+/H+ antiporter, TMEM165/GDT1 family